MTPADDSVAAQALPAWTRRIDRWEAATGLFVLTVAFAGRYLGENIHEYASLSS